MHCPTLRELPPPPQGKTGWPWTEESAQLPDTMPNGSLWPRISIVTPSFNQGEYIEETMRSVLLQGYPDLEYIIIDGSSTDQTLTVIKKYEKWLAYWESKSDRGQSHAINKGWLKSSGYIVGWVNSDDFLLLGSLEKLAVSTLKNSPRTIFAGDVFNVYTKTRGQNKLMSQAGYSLGKFVRFWESWTEPDFMWHQPGVFYTQSVVSSVGLLDETLTYTFDYDYMCRALQKASVFYLAEPIICFRVHSESKTTSQEPLVLFELLRTSKRYWSSLGLQDSSTGRGFVIQRSLLALNKLPLRHKLYLASYVLLKCILIDPFETIGYLSRKLFLNRV